MEKRKETLSSLRLCRFCLSQDDTLTSLYDGAPTPKNSVHLAQKILSSISVEVFPSDKMPTFICGRCRMLMNICHEYKQICRQVDENIFQYIQNGTQIKKVQWPPILTKILAKCDLKSNIKPANSVLETTVESGATVQVSPHELSDSEDDNENVINMNIEGSDNISKGNTCINMINKNEQIKITRVKSEINKEFSSGTKLARHIRTHAGERPYPCKYCNKSFLKSHHYTRHVRLKHSEAEQGARGAGGAGAGDGSEPDALRCEQCDESFATQDDLIYHSAIHATQNLICPLCQEKFDNVDEVTSHIKSHVSGEEFTCDFCELVFISNDKLEKHVAVAHEDEINEQEMALDESSMDIKVEDEDSESGIIVQKNDNQARNEFIISNKDGDSDEKVTNTNSEESESEMTYTELATVDTLAIMKKESPVKSVQAQPKDSASEAASKSEKLNKQTASILRRAEEIKRKTATPEIASVKVSNPISASDKSLRLLEKELQDLKRTNSRNDISKTPGKSMETLRNKRVVTSMPKPRMEEKKSQLLLHRMPVEKKMPERRGVKENKEPRDARDVKSNNGGVKEEVKEKEVKTIVKNGGSDKSMEEKVRRSSRQSKIKDYAKMSQGDDDEDDDTEDSDDEEYIETEKSDNRSKIRRSTVGVKVGGGLAPATPGPLASPGPPAPATPAPQRKRGRPRKDQTKDVPNKVKKINEDGDEVEEPMDKALEDIKTEEGVSPETKIEREIKTLVNEDVSKRVSPEQKASPGNVLVSPSGQTLKKVPIKSLPPGVRPLPLPINARPINSGELCEMQIGKKLVKVQKIVMTKAEVEAMAKKGLVEMKDGTMVLKQGIKLPTTDPVAIKSTLVGEADVSKESAPKAKVRSELEEE